MRDFVVVTLSRFPEVFAAFRSSVDRDAPSQRKIVVWDSRAPHAAQAMELPWLSVRTTTPFAMASNANLGWRLVPASHDILYAGDDTRIVTPHTIARLRALAYAVPGIGIVSARVKGWPHPSTPVFEESKVLPFIFVYVRREVVDAVGGLDERFQGYGVDDIDYVYRARLAGFKVGFANDIEVQHGLDADAATYATTFRRDRPLDALNREDAENWRRLAAKYGKRTREEVWGLIHA